MISCSELWMHATFWVITNDDDDDDNGSNVGDYNGIKLLMVIVFSLACYSSEAMNLQWWWMEPLSKIGHVTENSGPLSTTANRFDQSSSILRRTRAIKCPTRFSGITNQNQLAFAVKSNQSNALKLKWRWRVPCSLMEGVRICCDSLRKNYKNKRLRHSAAVS